MLIVAELSNDYASEYMTIFHLNRNLILRDLDLSHRSKTIINLTCIMQFSRCSQFPQYITLRLRAICDWRLFKRLSVMQNKLKMQDS